MRQKELWLGLLAKLSHHEVNVRPLLWQLVRVRSALAQNAFRSDFFCMVGDHKKHPKSLRDNERKNTIRS